MKILSFTHSQVVPNLYEFALPNTKEDILKNIRAPLTTIVFFFFYYGSQRCPKTVSKLSSKYLPLCLAEQIHTGLELLEGE